MSEPRGWWAAMRRRAEAAFGPDGSAVCAILGLLTTLQLDYVLRDTRLPRDANAALRHVPELAEAMQAGRAGEVLAGLARTGGWQEVSVAGLAVLFGRTPLVWHAWYTGWLLLAVAGLARATRAVRVDAVLPAVALFAGFPVLLEQARVGWIHLPELALILVAVALLLDDEPIDGVRAAILGGCLALTGTLRGSGLAWATVVALPALVRARSHGGAIACVLGGLGVALTVTGAEIAAYATEKAGAAVRYASLGGANGLFILRLSLGFVTTWVVAFGVGLGASAWPSRRRLALAGLVAFGIVVPLVSMFALSAPVANTPVFLAATALLGGMGLATLGRSGRWGAVVLSLPPLLGQLVPGSVTTPLGLPLALGRYWRDDAQNYQRPYPHGVARVIAEPLAACVARARPCSIVTESGLFSVTPEERGRLELFFLGYTPDEVVLTAPTHVQPMFPVDVVARYRCEGATEEWARRHPGYAEAAEALIVARGLTAERTLSVGPRCTYRWNTRP